MGRIVKRVVVPVVVVAVVLAVAAYWLFPGVALDLARRSELRAAGLDQHGIDVAGHRVEYLSGGQGETLLLLHGFGADKSNWVRVAKYLTPHFRIIAPDLPGFGQSSKLPGERYGIDDQVERVHALARALALDSFHVGGNSMGGEIAGVYAARYPAEVKSVWLLAPGGVASARRSELQERIAKGENPLFVSDVDGFERLLDFVFVARPYIPRAIERYLAAQAIANRPFNEKIGNDLRDHPIALEVAAKGLKAPTLIVWGDHDRLVDVSGAQILASVMPKAKVVVMTNVGHIPMVERPRETAEAFLGFRGFALEPS